MRRTLLATIVAVFTLCILLPFLYDVTGLRTNIEENIGPTLVAEMRRTPRFGRPTDVPPPPFPTLIPLTSDPNRKPRPTRAPEEPLPAGVALNGVPVSRLVLISDTTRSHIRDVYALGQSLGRNARAIAKVGDSTMVYPPFLATFDENSFRLGSYEYLRSTISYHSGSFGRESVAVKKGMHTWSQFDPAWSIPELCGPTEGPLECEFRLHNPAIAIIRLGANDIHYPNDFEKNLGSIVKFCLERGIIPVLGTKPDRSEGESNLINNIIRKTASAYNVPLWDYDLIAGTVPGRGLEPDGVHMLGGGTRDFNSPVAMRQGDALEDLTALMMLHAIRTELGIVQ